MAGEGYKKTAKPVSMQFSDYCYYFSFINYWCNYVIQSIQSTGPSYSDTRTRTGTDSKIITIEPDNLMDNNYSCLTQIVCMNWCNNNQTLFYKSII